MRPYGRRLDVSAAMRLAMMRLLDVIEHGDQINHWDRGLPEDAMDGVTSAEMDSFYARVRRVRDAYQQAVLHTGYYPPDGQ